MKINKISTDSLMGAIKALGIEDLAPISFSVTQESVSVEYYPRDVNGDLIIIDSGDDGDPSFEVTYVDIPLEKMPQQAVDAINFLITGKSDLPNERDLLEKNINDLDVHREAVNAMEDYARKMKKLGLDPWTWDGRDPIGMAFPEPESDLGDASAQNTL